MPYEVDFHEAARQGLAVLHARDRVAVMHASEKLAALGDRLPFPHQSGVQGYPQLRELRPRAGRCRWRAFYAQVGSAFIILAIGPEAMVDHRKFQIAVQAAARRLRDLEGEH